MKFIYIYESKSPQTNPPMIKFSYDGKRIPKSQMDKFFKEASEKLKVPENELCYERFD